MYKPTRESLNFFYPRLVKGGIIISNCYNSKVFPGESKTWDEFFFNKEYTFIYKHALSTNF
jgi:O-methyltransferase